jgi:two-component system sensor histidine kinase/response regulator
MTANAMQGDREACLKAGMDDYVSKPVTLNSLQQVLERYLVENTQSKEIKPQIRPPVEDQLAEDYLDILDQNALDNIRQLQTDTDSNLLKELIDLFLSESPKLINTIEQAIQTKDAKAIQFAAHRLKGSSAYLGVIRVCSLCSEIEEQSRDNRLEDLSNTILLLGTEYHRGLLALNHEKLKLTQ